MSDGARRRLTIGELADLAGVTPRAVRFYEGKGLLPEPDRDRSGYRRYDFGTVVDLVRIRTLADAGVPLARVGELLGADRATFRSALEDLDRELQRQAEAIEEHRQRVACLADVEVLALPEDVAAYLQQLEALGISERMRSLERDGWIFLTAHSPEQVAVWIDHKRTTLADPEFVGIYRRFDEALEWEPDDPRLEALADDLAAYTRRLLDEHPGVEEQSEFDDVTIELLDTATVRASPAWSRLMGLMVERGFEGWTDLHQAERPTLR